MPRTMTRRATKLAATARRRTPTHPAMRRSSGVSNRSMSALMGAQMVEAASSSGGRAAASVGRSMGEGPDWSGGFGGAMTALPPSRAHGVSESVRSGRPPGARYQTGEGGRRRPHLPREVAAARGALSPGPGALVGSGVRPQAASSCPSSPAQGPRRSPSRTSQQRRISWCCRSRSGALGAPCPRRSPISAEVASTSRVRPR